MTFHSRREKERSSLMGLVRELRRAVKEYHGVSCTAPASADMINDEYFHLVRMRGTTLVEIDEWWNGIFK
jgi:hypothetical protein